MQHFNNLTPKQAELLAMLAEECAEVIQAISKVLRHGLTNYHPENPSETNRDLLVKEIGDVIAVHVMMMEAGLLPRTDKYKIYNIISLIDRKLRYAHHQMETK